MTDAIYVASDDGSLNPLLRTPYRLEDDLQSVVAIHPELLPGDQINPENPRRWRLIRREAAVGSATDSRRWSLDHLFVDQDAIPTLVEAKRGGNPEARRDVVAQLLDYAANGTLYWPIDQLRSWFEDSRSGSTEAAESLADLLGTDPTDEEAYEKFWQDFEVNLRERRIPLVYVANAIPSELRTLVEFLNEQMPNVEVLAVEIAQYRDGSGRQLLRPQLVGQTSKARAQKHVSGGSKTLQSRSDFVDSVAPNLRPKVEAILTCWSEVPGATIGYGATRSVRLVVDDPTRRSGHTAVFGLEISGEAWFNRGSIIDIPAFGDPGRIKQLDTMVQSTLGNVAVGAKGYYARVADPDAAGVAALGKWIHGEFRRIGHPKEAR